MEVRNKVAVVTGASSGIDGAAAKILEAIKTGIAEAYAHDWMKNS